MAFSKKALACASLAATLSALALTFTSSALAFDPDLNAIEDQQLMQRFPAGSIVSRAAADQALSEVAAAKRRVRELADYSTRRCQENLFVNHCIDIVRQAKLRQERRLLAIEVEARQTIRDDESKREIARQLERNARSAAKPKPVATVKDERASTLTPQAAAKSQQARQKRQAEINERAKAAQAKADSAQQKRQEHAQKVRERAERRAEREKKLEERRRKNAERTAE